MLESPEKKRADGATSGPPNRRGNLRYPFSSSAEVIGTQGNTRIAGRIADIGRKGCYVDTISPFPPKTDVSVRITKDQQTFETKATVVYSQAGMGMGLLFTTTEPEQLRRLERWLAELSGEKAREPNLGASEAPLEAARLVDQEGRNGLTELVSLLSRKGVLTVPEATAILQRLLK